MRLQFIIILEIVAIRIECHELFVRLSDYKFTTEDIPLLESDGKIILPTFFKELEFECNSTFPTKWMLSRNPLEDRSLQSIPQIVKSRHTDANGKFTFSSKILFKFKDPRSIQTFSCESIEYLQNNNKNKISTSVETKVKTATRLVSEFIRNKEIHKTQNLYGESLDCDIEIEIDFVKKAFACAFQGEHKLLPRIELCQNADECDSVAYTGNPHCPNSVKLECLVGCNDFNPRKEPGIIICGNGLNSIAIGFAVLGIEGTNSSKLVPYNEASNPSDFIHIVQSDQSVYNMQQVDFTCKASKYVFSLGFQWLLKTITGEIHILKEGKENLIVKDGTYKISKQVLFNLNLYGNVTKLICVGPLWNSRQNVQSECDINIRGSIAPSIVEKNATVDVASGNYTLSCTYFGIPKPQITWSFWKRKIVKDEEFIKIEYRNESSFFTILNIESLAKDDRRLFQITCRAENFLGVTERLFIVRNEVQQTSNKILIISVISLIIVVLVLVIGGWLYLRWVRKKNLEYVKKDILLFLEGNSNTHAKDDKDISSLAQRTPYNPDLEIPFENLEFAKGNALGAGAYGLVLRAAAFIGSNPIRTDVAIKTLKTGAEPAHFKSLLMELKMMQYVGSHPNVVNLLGACTKKIYEMELFIVLELCVNGELEKYLKTHRLDFTWESEGSDTNLTRVENFSKKHLLKWSYEIASGMNYLASKKIIHGDLAARNVLLNENYTAKLCDFGLSRQLYQYSQYVKKQQAPLPFRWMAIESLRDFEFSTESDVWSYGVILFEIFSLGELPYPEQSWTNEFVQYLVDGNRLKKPVNCPDEIYQIMQDCWRKNPKDRITFLVLQNRFHQLRNSIPTPPPKVRYSVRY